MPSFSGEGGGAKRGAGEAGAVAGFMGRYPELFCLRVEGEDRVLKGGTKEPYGRSPERPTVGR